jgi:purine-nucleoside phosphorylase
MLESGEYGKIQQSAAYLKASVPNELSLPSVAIICGSGLGGLVGSIHQDVIHEIPFQDIPGFPVPTGKSSWWIKIKGSLTRSVSGHAGKIVFGFIGSSKSLAVFMVGRLQ